MHYIMSKIKMQISANFQDIFIVQIKRPFW